MTSQRKPSWSHVNKGLEGVLSNYCVQMHALAQVLNLCRGTVGSTGAESSAKAGALGRPQAEEAYREWT